LKKIKIAFVIDTITDNFGGTERQLVILLERLNRSRFVPYLCCFKTSKWLQNHACKWNMHIFRFKSFFSPIDYLRLYKFSKFLKNENIDIVQTYFRDGNIIGIIAAKIAGINCIISTRRNMGYWHTKKELVLLKLINPMVSNFLANSFAIKDYLIYAEKISAHKIDVIYNGVELKKFSNKSPESMLALRNKLGISRNNTVITSVANLRPVKGIDILLKSAKLVIEKVPDAIFLIVGDGSERLALTELAQKLSIDSHVKFLGSINNVHDVLSISDIGVLSSHSEGLSNSIIEYMAGGLPVVATDVGGNSELIGNMKTGYLVNPGDPAELYNALAKLLNDPERAKKFGRASRSKVVDMFQIDRTVHQTEKHFENIFFNKAHMAN